MVEDGVIWGRLAMVDGFESFASEGICHRVLPEVDEGVSGYSLLLQELACLVLPCLLLRFG